MKVKVRLEKSEKDAIKVIGDIKCPVIPCGECPLHYDKNDSILCLKNVCEIMLEKYINQD